jgi:hypothetical protein
MPDLNEIAIWLGLDVGKGKPHANALTPASKRLHLRALPNTERNLRALFAKLTRHGRVLVGVDQPSIAACWTPRSVRSAGCRLTPDRQ